MALTLPRRNPKPNHGRQLQAKHHHPSRPVVREFHPTLAAHRQRGPNKRAADHRRILWLLAKRLVHQRLCSDLLVPVINRPLHRVVPDPYVLVRVPGRRVDRYLGVLEPGFLAQARNRELVDVEPGPVGAEAEPENESDEADDEEKAQEDGAYHLGDPGGEAFFDPVGVVSGRVVALQRSGLGARLDREYSVLAGRVHFLDSGENGSTFVVIVIMDRRFLFLRGRFVYYK